MYLASARLRTWSSSRGAGHYSLYLARAWVLEEPPEALSRRIDVSLLARGDLMFMHKLAEAIKAARR